MVMSKRRSLSIGSHLLGNVLICVKSACALRSSGYNAVEAENSGAVHGHSHSIQHHHQSHI